MSTGRLEAFSDGVIAIIITIMVLELKAQEEFDLSALGPLIPALLSYVLSFVFLAIYWTNHHHLYQVVRQVDGRILWANLHLLFWLSLVPFATRWMGDSDFASWPVAIYGIVLLMAALAWWIMAQLLIAREGTDSPLVAAVGPVVKERLSLALYAAGIASSFWNRWIACSIYVLVAAMWLVPDRRIERVLVTRDMERER